MERNCGNCDYSGADRFLTIGGGRHERPESLVCRRYPPTVAAEMPFGDGQIRLTSTWPHVTAEDRCGEFTPKVDETG